MKPNLPNWLFLGGIGALAISNTCKELLPDTLGRVFALHWGCAIVSAALFSIGLLFSLRGVFADAVRPSRFILPLFCNLLFLVLLLGLYFMGFVFMSKFYQFGSDSLFPNLLPKLISQSQQADTIQKRVKAAQAAYELYGVKLVYRDEAGNLAAYSPAPKDDAFFAHEKETEARNQTLLAQLKGALDQYPYLFSFYLGAFLLTFLIGPLCFVFGGRRPVLIAGT